MSVGRRLLRWALRAFHPDMCDVFADTESFSIAISCSKCGTYRQPDEGSDGTADGCSIGPAYRGAVGGANLRSDSCAIGGAKRGPLHSPQREPASLPDSQTNSEAQRSANIVAFQVTVVGSHRSPVVGP